MRLDEEGNYAKRVLEDGRVVYVIPLTYGRARICISGLFDPYLAR